MTGCFHIVVAMKPTRGNFAENALRHGVAGLNIDASRVVYDADSFERNQKASERPAREHPKAVWKDSGHTERRDVFSPLGRFPANVILSHAEGCVLKGTKKVKSNPHLGQKNPDMVKQYDGGSFGGGIVKPDSGYADAEGNEVVEDWNCVELCPVRMLDDQSGDRPAGKWNRTDGARPFDNDGKETGYQEWQKVEDSGGASRYFFTVKEYHE